MVSTREASVGGLDSSGVQGDDARAGCQNTMPRGSPEDEMMEGEPMFDTIMSKGVGKGP